MLRCVAVGRRGDGPLRAKRVERQPVRQRLGPRATRRCVAEQQRGFAARGDEHIELVAGAGPQARRWCAPRSLDQPEAPELHRTCSAERRGPPCVGGLDRDRLVASHPHDGHPRTSPRQEGRHRRADHVVRIGAILHPQGDLQLRVCPDAIADRPGRALRGEHEMDAEAAASLRDVDERVDERGQLGLQRGELVDHQRQPGKSSRTAALVTEADEGVPI